MKEKIFELAREFSKETHGRTDYDKDQIYVMSDSREIYVPFSFILKHCPDIKGPEKLQADGFVCSSYTFLDNEHFDRWYEHQFSKKLTSKISDEIDILHYPDNKSILEAIEGVNKYYEEFRRHQILVNGKNLPVQLGEWFAKVIFGLKQVKSSSQRGFDFYIGNNLVEVKIHWADQSSPKGVKIRKPLIELSDCCIIIYLSRGLMIRDICFLDSDFISRKFQNKGHTLFLKDADVSSYFFSKSSKHFDKIINKAALMKFSNPNFAMKLDGRLE